MSTASLRDEPMNKPKPFIISKQMVMDAFESVRANKGAAGVDDESIAEFEADLKPNLYKLWNRMSSGSYFPQPVRAVEIPKKDGKGSRILGIPTVADRIAQTVVKMLLEPKVEPVFHDESYGYRPGRSAHDALEACRRRCWKTDWVIDLDIKSFFDTVDHELVLNAVARHTEQKWILLYVQRWLKAPIQHADGTLEQRDRGTPQGSAISPLLANLFMHYAFDTWMKQKFPVVRFERYCDDVVVHCTTERQALFIKDCIVRRLAGFGLKVHGEKTRIVYCKDANRQGSASYEQFDFLGYTFRPRLSLSKNGAYFVSFSPGISAVAKKAIGKVIRALRINRRSDRTLEEFASMLNPLVQGWVNYYGRFYRSELRPILRRINAYLIRWAMGKYKRLRNRPSRARNWLIKVFHNQPELFAHWRVGAQPEGWTIGAV